MNLEKNFEPTYDIIRGKESTVSALKRAAKKAAGIWLATDLDREGEAIACHLVEALEVNPEEAKRVVFNAITRSEIEKAFRSPREIDLAKVNAQQARRVLDRIVGYQVSPLLWFAHGCWVEVRKYRRGAADPVSATLLWQRFKTMVGRVLSHRTIERRDKAAGQAHRLIFFGFAALFIGTATITLEYDITARLFGWKFWYGDFYLWFSRACDLGGLGLVAGLLYMMARRGRIQPPKLDYARPDREPGAPDYDRRAYRIEDWAFLWTLILIGVTGFVLEAARLVWLQERPEVWTLRWWSPIGALLAERSRQRLAVGAVADCHRRRVDLCLVGDGPAMATAVDLHYRLLPGNPSTMARKSKPLRLT